MTIIQDIKRLREETGAGMMECKKALEQCSGDVNAAKVYMRKQGIINNKSRGHKATPEGVIGTYAHVGNRICVMVEVNCETDFVARNNVFREFAHNLAMHVAAAKPRWLDRSNVPKEVIDTEEEIILSKLTDKPANIQQQILAGKINKFYKENCFMEQAYIKDQKISIQDYYNNICLQFKEKIVVKRFSRFEIGLDV